MPLANVLRSAARSELGHAARLHAVVVCSSRDHCSSGPHDAVHLPALRATAKSKGSVSQSVNHLYCSSARPVGPLQACSGMRSTTSLPVSHAVNDYEHLMSQPMSSTNDSPPQAVPSIPGTT